MTTRVEHREPGAITTDRSRSNLTGTWTIDPAHSTISFAWRTLRLWAITGRSDCSGLIHIDELPPVGVIRFQQPSSLPVLTMALDPASLETGAADRNAMLWGRGIRALRQHRWWTLHRLVLRGRGALDRRAFPTGTRATSFDPAIRLELAVHARRVAVQRTR